jgi:hypothetical protein
MQSAADFRTRAEQCRRLARSISYQNDPAVAHLLTLAREYDAKAVELEEEEAKMGRDASRPTKY